MSPELRHVISRVSVNNAPPPERDHSPMRRYSAEVFTGQLDTKHDPGLTALTPSSSVWHFKHSQALFRVLWFFKAAEKVKDIPWSETLHQHLLWHHRVSWSSKRHCVVITGHQHTWRWMHCQVTDLPRQVSPLTTQNVQNGESHMFTPSLTHWARPQQESFPLLLITQPIVKDSFWDVISRPSILISWTACIMEALMHGGETIQSLSPSFHYGESCLRQHCHCLMSHPSMLQSPECSSLTWCLPQHKRTIICL